MNTKKEFVVELVALVLSFWIFKIFIALITCGYIGMMLSYPVVGAWSLLFQAINADALREYFCSIFTLSSLEATPDVLAIDYLRVGILETLMLIGICVLCKEDEKSTAKSTEEATAE